MDRKETSSSSPPPLPSSLRDECVKAVDLVKSYPEDAIEHITDLVSCNPEIAFVHYIESVVHVKVANVRIWKRQEAIKEALHAAKTTIELDQNSIQFSYHYASVLNWLGIVFNGKYYQDAIDECNRGLLIENPQDPKPDTLQQEIWLDTESKEERIEVVKQDIRRLRESAESAKETIAERKEGVKSYWEKLGREQKLRFFSVNVEQLKQHYNSIEDTYIKEVLLQAISHGKKVNKWKFWLCCYCETKFGCHESWMKHVWSEHVEKLEPGKNTLIATIASKELTETIYGTWLPVDAASALKIIKDKSRLQFTTHTDDAVKGGNVQDNPEVSLPGIPGKWPIRGDSEKANLIVSIQERLQYLARKKCLSLNHTMTVMTFTKKFLKHENFTQSEIEDHCLDRSLSSICFMEVSWLKRINNALEKVASLDQLSYDVDKMLKKTEYADMCSITERIVFSKDYKSLHLISNSCSEVANKEIASVSDAELKGNNKLPDCATFLSDLLDISSGLEQLEKWESQLKDRRDEALSTFNEMKWQFQNYVENIEMRECNQRAFNGLKKFLEDVKLNDDKKREGDSNYCPQPVASHLLKYKENKSERGESADLNIIEKILHEAEIIGAIRFGFKGSQIGVFREPDFNCKDSESETPDYQKKADFCVNLAFTNESDNVLNELWTYDALMLVWEASKQQLELKLSEQFAYDYQLIMAPLLRSFILAQVEADVKAEALFGIGPVTSSMGKKKNKKRKKGKASKRSVVNKTKPSNLEVEQQGDSDESEVELGSLEIGVSASNEDLVEQSEEIEKENIPSLTDSVEQAEELVKENSPSSADLVEQAEELVKENSPSSMDSLEQAEGPVKEDSPSWTDLVEQEEELGNEKSPSSADSVEQAEELVRENSPSSMDSLQQAEGLVKENLPSSMDSVEQAEGPVKENSPSSIDSVDQAEGLVKEKSPSSTDSVEQAEELVKENSPSSMDSLEQAEGLVKETSPSQADLVEQEKELAKEKPLSWADLVEQEEELANEKPASWADLVEQEEEFAKEKPPSWADLLEREEELEREKSPSFSSWADLVEQEEELAKEKPLSWADLVDQDKELAKEKSPSFSFWTDLVEQEGELAKEKPLSWADLVEQEEELAKEKSPSSADSVEQAKELVKENSPSSTDSVRQADELVKENADQKSLDADSKSAEDDDSRKSEQSRHFILFGQIRTELDLHSGPKNLLGRIFVGARMRPSYYIMIGQIRTELDLHSGPKNLQGRKFVGARMQQASVPTKI